jgi:hypothetical protein
MSDDPSQAMPVSNSRQKQNKKLPQKTIISKKQKNSQEITKGKAVASDEE